MAISNNSTGLRPGVCTSTTRPTAPYEGQHIYETDTDLVYLWNGTAWVETVSALTKAPRGIVGYTRYTSGNQTVTSATAVDITGLTTTINAVSTRLYKISFNLAGRKNSNAGYFFVNTVAGASTINEWGATNVSGGYIIFSGSSFISGISGSTVIKLQTYIENSSGTMFFGAASPGFLTVEDVGPV